MMNGPNFNIPDPSAFFAQSMEGFTKFWNEASGQYHAGNPMDIPTPDSMRKMRDDILRSMTSSYDEYLRSPVFAGQLRQMLQQGVQAQQKIAEILGKAQNTCQAPSRQDVDALMEVMQRLERRMGEGFERLDERVRSLEGQIAGMPAMKEAAPRKPARKVPAKKAAKKSSVGRAAKKVAKKSATKRVSRPR